MAASGVVALAMKMLSFIFRGHLHGLASLTRHR